LTATITATLIISTLMALTRTTTTDKSQQKRGCINAEETI